MMRYYSKDQNGNILDLHSVSLSQKIEIDDLNYLIFTFLSVKHYRFKDLKAAPYLVKNQLQKRMLKGNDLAYGEI